jgi:hypothetical protein
VSIGLTIAAAEPSYYFPLFLVVGLLGAGGFGSGVWAIIRHVFNRQRGLNELLMVLRGDEGGSGRRSVPPLVDVVDKLVKTTERIEATQVSSQHAYTATLAEHTEALKGLKLAHERALADILVINRQITPNGGNTNSLGDRIVRTERGIALLSSKVEEGLSAGADRDMAVKTALERENKKVVKELETHIVTGHPTGGS